MSNYSGLWTLEEAPLWFIVRVGPNPDDGISFGKNERDLAEMVVKEHNLLVEFRESCADIAVADEAWEAFKRDNPQAQAVANRTRLSRDRHGEAYDAICAYTEGRKEELDESRLG